jgi:predicted ATPase/class 3 adenylate cyclase
LLQIGVRAIILPDMAVLPSGTVTFLFTDAEGSTALLRRLGPDAYARELEGHWRVLRETCASHNGVEVDSAGDSVFMVFSRAADAVAAAQAAQAGLERTEINVRMGLHTGEPLVTELGYIGMDVHRAARISAAGHGGQVLVSRATRSLVEDVVFLDLGEHRLKDLTHPERIYQLGAREFPALKSLNRTNLPVAGQPLVGRAVEQRELIAALRAHRLVTVTGTGGSGKTRLALQIAAELVEEHADGAFFVPLAAFSDPDLVVPAVVRVLGLAEPEAVNHADALIVLDNFEHVSGAAPNVASLLADAPGLRLLVTSTTPLHLSAEFEYPLDPLPHDAAIELFLQRAQVVHRRIEPSETVSRICRRLDGLPLALELAAARLKLLDPAALLDRLDSRLLLLTHGPRDLPERHRTLEATIAWSYDLLDQEAQTLFARLSVFADTFGLDAVEEVARGDLDTLAALVDASLVKPIGESRFLLLGTLREFAAGRLEPGDRDELAARHGTYYLELARRAEPELTGRDTRLWLAQLDADHPNLRAALDGIAEPDRAVELTSALWRFWFVRGHFEEAQARIGHALDLNREDARRADLLYKLGAIVISRGDTEESRRLFSEALALNRSLGDQPGAARSLMALGHVDADCGEWEQARDYYEDAARLFRELGDELGVSGVLGDLASLLVRSGKAAEAVPIAEESVRLQRQLGYEQGVALGMATQAYACMGVGDLQRARLLLAESTQMAHRLGYQHGLVYCLNGLGRLAFECDDLEQAADAFGAAYRLRREIGIEHDPDDVLVAHARAAVEERLARSVDDEESAFDLSKFISASVSSSSS